MDIERAVEDFVHRGKDLFDRLRAEGQTLSSLGLQILRTQLHILHVEVAHLKHEKANAEQGKAQAETAVATQKIKALKPASTCMHSRAIDDYIDEKGKRTDLCYCLECGAVIGGPSDSK